jgi:hypothetical protein
MKGIKDYDKFVTKNDKFLISCECDALVWLTPADQRYCLLPVGDANIDYKNLVVMGKLTRMHKLSKGRTKACFPSLSPRMSYTRRY